MPTSSTRAAAASSRVCNLARAGRARDGMGGQTFREWVRHRACRGGGACLCEGSGPRARAPLPVARVFFRADARASRARGSRRSPRAPGSRCAKKDSRGCCVEEKHSPGATKSAPIVDLVGVLHSPKVDSPSSRRVGRIDRPAFFPRPMTRRAASPARLATLCVGEAPQVVGQRARPDRGAPPARALRVRQGVPFGAVRARSTRAV